MDTEDLLRAAFDAYNRRDSKSLLSMLTDDVTWPGDTGVLNGKTEIDAYWQRQWLTTRTHDEVLRVEETARGDVVVSLHQVVRMLDGAVISTGELKYRFSVHDGLIRALRTREA